LKQWEKDDSEARRVRAVGAARERTDQTNQTDRSDQADVSDHKMNYARWLEHREPAVVANAMICLIHQANYLLDRQIHGLERQFVEEGGYSERLAAARLEKRRQAISHPTDRSDKSKTLPAAPNCAVCGKAMVLRTARKGAKAGSQFWGCSGYPQCKSTLPL
jgi:restriction system protein